jgi:eukaryotic-like serine/threonine-protein kinase
MSPLQRCLDDDEILAFVDGTIDAATRAVVCLHLDACVDCRVLVADAARVGDEEGSEAKTAVLQMPKEQQLTRGASVGRYILEDTLGNGSMGIVYRAVDPQLHRPVAIKVLRPDSSDTALEGRLMQEAQVMAQLAHPHVVRVYDAGMAAGRVFIAMELVEGTTLSDWLRREPRSWSDVLDVFVSAGRGLEAAHAKGIIHRDFKAANVLMSNDQRVLVTDFGLARPIAMQEGPSSTAPMLASLAAWSERAGTFASSTGTGTGSLAGTPAYMAPELWAGQRADMRSDQFAFSVALYDALYGVHPPSSAFAGRTTGLPARGAPPRRLRAIVSRGFAEDPSARFPSMEDLLSELAEPRRRFSRALVVGTFVAAALVGAVGLNISRGTSTATSASADHAATSPRVPGSAAAPPSVSVANEPVSSPPPEGAEPAASAEPIGTRPAGPPAAVKPAATARQGTTKRSEPPKRKTAPKTQRATERRDGPARDQNPDGLIRDLWRRD